MTAPGLVTDVGYHETGGWLGKWITVLFLFRSPPSGPYRKLRHSYNETRCEVIGSTRFCYHYSYYEYEPPTSAAWADYYRTLRDVNAYNAALLFVQHPTEMDFRVASTALGGDTSGWEFTILWRIPIAGLFGFKMMEFAMGEHFAFYTTIGRSRRSMVMNEDGAVTIQDVSADVKYRAVALPMRLTGFIFPNVGIYFQTDNNLYSLFDHESIYSPSLYRMGLMASWGRVFLRGEVLSSDFTLDSFSAFLEAGLGL